MEIYEITREVLDLKPTEMAKKLKVSRQLFQYMQKDKKTITLGDLQQCIDLCNNFDQKKEILSRVFSNLKL